MRSLHDDFPFYDGRPVNIEAKGWLVILVSVIGAFMILTLTPRFSFPSDLLPAILFVAIPLLTLHRIAGSSWKCLFRPISLRFAGLMVLFGAATLAASLVIGWMLRHFFDLYANPLASEFLSMSEMKIGQMLFVTGIQLIGEELLAILPFLAVLRLCKKHLQLSRTVGIVIALTISSLIFGAAHLPTYDWHWAQSLIGVSLARTVLTLAYLATRNLWVSAGAHVINDWTIFLLAAEYEHAHLL